MKAGDLLFYRSNNTSIFDRAISLLNKISGMPDYVHVAIQFNDHQKIEMLGQGCVIDAYIPDTVATEWSYAPINDQEAFNTSLGWLFKQVGQPYGWNDVAEAIDTSHRFLWLQTNHVDCSHLAAEFLQRSGYDVDGLGNDLARVTPGILAKFLRLK